MCERETRRHAKEERWHAQEETCHIGRELAERLAPEPTIIENEDHPDPSYEIRILTTDEILQEGLQFVNVDEGRQNRATRATNVTRFRTEYGCDPAVLAQLWLDLQTNEGFLVNADGGLAPTPVNGCARNASQRLLPSHQFLEALSDRRPTVQ